MTVSPCDLLCSRGVTQVDDVVPPDRRDGVACRGRLTFGPRDPKRQKPTGSRRWPQTPGRVVRSFVLVQTDADGVRVIPRKLGTNTRPRETRIKGCVFVLVTDRELEPGAGGARDSTVSPSSTVPVLFDPRKPADAVLVSGTSSGNLPIAFSGVAVLVCAYLLHIK